MRYRLLPAAAVAITCVFACAKGTSVDDGAGGDTSVAATTGVSGSLHGSTGTLSGSSTGSPASSGTSGGSTAMSSSTGAPCTEMPCKLTEPQCGCPAGKACSVNGNGRLCVTPGMKQWGEACAGASDCVEGTVCLSPPGGDSVCFKFCGSDAECTPPGGLCVIGVNGANMMMLPMVTLCSANCDPLTNTGCTVAANLKCAIGQEQMGQMRDFTTCVGAGMGTQGTACMTDGDCAAGFACLNSGGNTTCYKYCNVAVGGCPNPMQCLPINDANMMPLQVGGTQYGACL